MADYTGKRTGNFTIVKKLGDGGFATVYLGQHTVLEKKAAVKFLLEEWVNEPDVVARFFDEARTMERLQDHPNIVRIIDIANKEVCEKEGVPPYFIMNYVEGKSLEALIQGDEGFTLEFMVDICKKVLSALDFCHKRGIIHRDIKPSNILVESSGHVWLMDFGIAKAKLNTSKTGEGLTLGSCDYMSPEQALGKRDMDHRSDIYSFGVTMYQMVLGKLPFINENPNAVALAHIQEEPVPPKSINSAVPDRLNYIILKAMEKKPEDRFQSCQEMIEALEHLEDPEPEIKAEVPTIDLTKTPGADLPEDSVRTDHETTTRKQVAAQSESKLQQALGSSAVRNVLRLAAFILAFTALFLGGMKVHQWMYECALSIDTIPGGASVYVNDTLIGTSPAQLTVKQGDYKIVCTMAGYRDNAMRINLAGKNTMVLRRRMYRLRPELLEQFDEAKKTLPPYPTNAKPKDKPALVEKFNQEWAKITRLLDENPIDEDLHDRFADFAKSKGLINFAEAYYRTNWEKDKDNPLMLTMLGRVQFLKNEMDHSLNTLSESWVIDPNSIPLLNYLGEYFLKRGEKDKAKAYFQMSVSLRKDPEIEQKLLDL